MADTNTTARRAILPEVMLAEDVALALGVPQDEASRLMESGSIGPCRKIGSRFYVTRESLLMSIDASARPGNGTALRTNGETTHGAP